MARTTRRNGSSYVNGSRPLVGNSRTSCPADQTLAPVGRPQHDDARSRACQVRQRRRANPPMSSALSALCFAGLSSVIVPMLPSNDLVTKSALSRLCFGNSTICATAPLSRVPFHPCSTELACDVVFPHAGLQGRSLQSQASRRAVRTSDLAFCFFQRLQNPRPVRRWATQPAIFRATRTASALPMSSGIAT